MGKLEVTSMVNSLTTVLSFASAKWDSEPNMYATVSWFRRKLISHLIKMCLHVYQVVLIRDSSISVFETFSWALFQTPFQQRFGSHVLFSTLILKFFASLRFGMLVWQKKTCVIISGRLKTNQFKY